MLALLGATTAARAEPAPLVDRLRLAVGPFSADASLGIRVAIDPGEVPESAGLQPGSARLRERGNTWRWDLSGSFDRRHGWRVGGFRVDGEASGAGSRLLIDDEREIRIDAAVRGSLEIEAHSLSYAWWLLDDGERAASLGLGLIRYSLATRVQGELSADGVGQVGGTARYQQDAIAPVLRMEYVQRLGRRWRGGFDLAFVRKPSGPLTGTAFDAGLGIEWRPLPWLGLSGRYAWTDLDLRFERRLGTARVNIRTHGPQLLASWQW